MDVINKWTSALFILFVLVATGNCMAQNKPGAPGNQRVQFYFNNPITLDSLTKYVHSRSKIRFSFNSTKVKGSKLINLKKGVYTLELLLQQIQQNTSLYYAMYNGYVIFQDNPPKQRSTAPPVLPGNKIKPPVRKQAIVFKPVPKQNNKPVTRPSATETKPPPTAIVLQGEADKTAIPASADTVSHAVAIVPADTPVVNNRLTAQSRDSIQTAAIPTATTKDQATTTAGIQDNSSYNGERAGWHLQFGLQWKAALPLHGSDNYFTGTNTRSEPYNLLIPGLWLSTLINDRHEIMLLVKPAEWYYYNKKAFRIDSGFLRNNFDTIPVRTNTRLVKTGGLYGSLQYNYHLNENWMVGAGLGYHLRGRGLAYKQNYQRFVGTPVSDSLYNMKNDSETNQYLAASFLSAKLEAGYRIGALHLGVTLLMPLTDPFSDKSLNKSRPLNVQLFMRWRIKRRNDD